MFIMVLNKFIVIVIHWVCQARIQGGVEPAYTPPMAEGKKKKKKKKKGKKGGGGKEPAYKKGMYSETQRKSSKWKILKSKIGLLCDTRWVERHTFFADFSVLYEPLLDALQAITSSAGYDTKAVTEANGLFHQITTSGFISAFVVCQYVLGFTKQLSIKLQSSQIDIAKAYRILRTFKLW